MESYNNIRAHQKNTYKHKLHQQIKEEMK